VHGLTAVHGLPIALADHVLGPGAQVPGSPFMEPAVSLQGSSS